MHWIAIYFVVID